MLAIGVALVCGFALGVMLAFAAFAFGAVAAARVTVRAEKAAAEVLLPRAPSPKREPPAEKNKATMKDAYHRLMSTPDVVDKDDAA